MRLRRPQGSPKLILDIGCHFGLDTEFYLNRGNDVIAVDANPKAVEAVTKKFSKMESKFRVIHGAIGPSEAESVPFYINQRDDSFSSIFHQNASRQGQDEIISLDVPTVKLAEIIAGKDVPYYLKADISGAEEFLLMSMGGLKEIPQYCSIAITKSETITDLYNLGYKYFQIKNQLFNSSQEDKEVSPEGRTRRLTYFTGLHSGLFGEDLPDDEWMNLSDTLEFFHAYLRVCKGKPLIDSWFDVHARRFEKFIT